MDPFAILVGIIRSFFHPLVSECVIRINTIALQTYFQYIIPKVSIIIENSFNSHSAQFSRNAEWIKENSMRNVVMQCPLLVS
jgi:hypothetical protein